MLKLALALNLALLVLVFGALSLNLARGNGPSVHDLWLPFFGTVLLMELLSALRRARARGHRA